MSSIKRYEYVNRDDVSLNFGISRMQDIFDKRQGVVDAPHRHNFFTVIVVQSANGIHNIDFNQFNLEASQVYFLSPGQVHQIVEEENHLDFLLSFLLNFN